MADGVLSGELPTGLTSKRQPPIVEDARVHHARVGGVVMPRRVNLVPGHLGALSVEDRAIGSAHGELVAAIAHKRMNFDIRAGRTLDSRKELPIGVREYDSVPVLGVAEVKDAVAAPVDEERDSGTLMHREPVQRAPVAIIEIGRPTGILIRGDDLKSR